MSRVLYSIIFHPTLNKIGTRLFKPFSSILPKKLKIPIIGFFYFCRGTPKNASPLHQSSKSPIILGRR
jgi:hypothetical protein